MTCNSSFVNPLILLVGKLLCDKYSEMRILRVLVLLKQFTIKKKAHKVVILEDIYRFKKTESMYLRSSAIFLTLERFE